MQRTPGALVLALRLTHAALALVILLGGFAHAADSVASGTIIGTVTNLTTGNGLEGAKVDLPQLGLSALVDKTGRYVITGVPEGTYEIVATYSGLDRMKTTVAVVPGQRATRDFDLTSSIYMLDPFKVAGEKEGLAAAITQQRNADYVTNVVSMDAYGNLPNLNATELAMRLPGVTFGNPGEEVVETISVRGMGEGMTTITIDGGLMSSFGAEQRNTHMTAFTGAMFESLEIIKGMTPDQGAESLGGRVNFKTRSPLSMKEDRRISYTLSATHVPSFTEQVPLREKHRTHPLFNGSYMQKFRVFGSSEGNLAVSVNMFYSENAFGYFQTLRDYQQTTSQPAYLWDYRTIDNYNNRVQKSINTKWDFRLSSRSLLKLHLIYSDAPEPMRRQYQTRAFTGNQTTVPGAATGVVPGAFTDRVTVVRAVPTGANATSATTPATAIDVTATMRSVVERLRHADISGEHTMGRFEYDWAMQWSSTRRRKSSSPGALINRIGGVPYVGPNGNRGSATNNIVGPRGETGVGWILDRTQSDLYPQFIQNGGLDFTDPNNYRPTQNGLSTDAGDLTQHLVRDVRGNAKYKLPVESFSAFLKSGGQVREQTVTFWQTTGRRWSYLGTTALPTDPSIRTWDNEKTGRNLPVWEAAAFIQDGQPTNPTLWEEDLYFHEMRKYVGYYRVQETVSAGYIMLQGRIGNNGFLTGVRGEKTDTKSETYVRNRFASTAAQQIADPAGQAARDYAGNLRQRRGTYTKYFPSVHLWRNFASNLKGRASWSTSFGRPSMLDALPTETISEANQTLTTGNPALLPQTASNWDFTAEYYFEPSGSFTVGWFHKTIKDYIVRESETGTIGTGADNGYNGEFPGFALLTSVNGGTAITEGWEFSYVQQFRFLPGLLKGTSLNANFTIINAHGDFGDVGAYRGNGEVEGFIPRTGNISLSWNYRRFGTRILYNYTATHIRSFNAQQPSRNQYMMAREMVNVGVTYRVHPKMTLQIDVANIFNEPRKQFRHIPDQLQMLLMKDTGITVGVQGQF